MFKIGDQVTWTSQAGGRTVTKEGAIFEIVAAGAKPTAKIKDPGFPRDHESYVVRGYKNTDRKRVNNYWPVVKNLRPKFGVFDEQALRSEIVRVWGPAGAHVDVYDVLLSKAGLLAPPPSPHPMETAAKQWEATVQEELRRAKASGDAIAIQMAEWGVKVVTAIINGEAPKPG
jgi:hypothetical protein